MVLILYTILPSLCPWCRSSANIQEVDHCVGIVSSVDALQFSTLGGGFHLGGNHKRLTFGSLALFAAMENKVVGGMIAFVTIFTVLRIVVKIVRA